MNAKDSAECATAQASFALASTRHQIKCFLEEIDACIASFESASDLLDKDIILRNVLEKVQEISTNSRVGGLIRAHAKLSVAREIERREYAASKTA